MRINCCWGGSDNAVLTAGSVPSRNARRRGSGRACCSCNTGCTGRNRSTPCTSIAFPWCHASCSCHRLCWSGARLEGKGEVDEEKWACHKPNIPEVSPSVVFCCRVRWRNMSCPAQLDVSTTLRCTSNMQVTEGFTAHVMSLLVFLITMANMRCGRTEGQTTWQKYLHPPQLLVSSPPLHSLH